MKKGFPAIEFSREWVGPKRKVNDQEWRGIVFFQLPYILPRKGKRLIFLYILWRWFSRNWWQNPNWRRVSKQRKEFSFLFKMVQKRICVCVFFFFQKKNSILLFLFKKSGVGIIPRYFLNHCKVGHFFLSNPAPFWSILENPVAQNPFVWFRTHNRNRFSSWKSYGQVK